MEEGASTDTSSGGAVGTVYGRGSMLIVTRVIVYSPASSGPPQSISGSVISSTSLQLSWSPPLSVHQNGLIQSYTILVFEQQTNTTIEKHQNFLQNHYRFK